MTGKSKTSKNKAPAEIIRDGELAAAIWKHSTPKGPVYSITFERSYTGPDGKTRYTKSFKSPHLPQLAGLVTRAHCRVRYLSQHIRVS